MVRRIAKWAAIVLAAIVVLIGAFLLWLNTDPGRRFIAGQINAFEAASGLKVHVERIEGSVFGTLRLVDVSISDPQGAFFHANQADLDYRPFAYLRSHIDIRSLDIPEARLSRLPAFRPGDPNAPMLPDIDLDIGRRQRGERLPERLDHRQV